MCRDSQCKIKTAREREGENDEIAPSKQNSMMTANFDTLYVFFCFLVIFLLKFASFLGPCL